MLPWFRFYREVIDDPKVQRLAPHSFKGWVNLLCLAAENEGRLPAAIADIAFRLRLSVQDAEQLVDELILAGLIDIGRNGDRAMHNWPNRQRPSDHVAPRVRAHRARLKAARQSAAGNSAHEPGADTCNVTGNETVTAQTQTQKREEKINPHFPHGSDTPGELSLNSIDGGSGQGGRKVSVDAQRTAARALGIGDAAPLVPIFLRWPKSRSARDLDAMFIASAETILANAPEPVRRACGVIQAAEEIVAPSATPSLALINRLRSTSR